MLKTFHRGGVHPPDSKITADSRTETLSIPAEVIVPVSQHLGTPSIPVVAKGDKVLAGQLIAKINGFLSANIHSPVSGKVTKIDAILDLSGYKQTAIVIESEGDDWVDTIDRSEEHVSEITLTPEEIIERCRECGIVGLGGAAFPTHIKLKVPEGKKCSLLIINGVECEPYLTSDHRLMIERGNEILTGTRAMMKALGVTRAVIGIENNKPDAINNLRELLNGSGDIEVTPLKVKYPQGGEKQLIKALVNREVPSGGLPIDTGVVVQNAGTAFAVYEAVQKNKPLFERVVTITGNGLKKPSNLRVRIGTPVKALVEAAGGLPEDAGKIINGGPMMGRSIPNLDIPVTKATSGIVIIPETEARRPAFQPCIRCGRCLDVCFFGLEPSLLMSLTEKGFYERAEAEKITDCCECGSCSYICPARRPLLDYIRQGKATVINARRLKK